MDANRIARRLWQGSHPPYGPTLRQNGVDTLVLCAIEHQDSPERYPGVKVIHAPMDDGAVVPITLAMRTAERVARELRANRRVMIACHAGLNRSGLVSALTLWLVTGASGAACVNRVQAARPEALCNPAFERFLRGLPSRTNHRTQEAESRA